jgi:hypothetical protein
MPIVFIHGVNARDGKSYRNAVGLRRKMFERLVVPVVRERFADFHVVEVFWGGLGMAFAWKLASIPDTKFLDTLGPEDEPAVRLVEHTQLLDLLGDAQPARPTSPELERLGTAAATLSNRLAAAARKDARGTIQAVLEGERVRVAASLERPPDEQQPDQASLRQAEREGELTALFLMAAAETGESDEVARRVAEAPDDDAVMTAIMQGVEAHYQRLVAEEEQVEGLGPVAWLRRRLSGVARRVEEVVTTPERVITRASSISLFKLFRKGVNTNGAYLVGDVLEYKLRGQAADGIADLVASEVSAAASTTDPGGEREPLVVVTHSFGSAIFYDLVTSVRLKGLPVDLWVMAGSQASLFAEMRFYQESPPNMPSTDCPVLGKPANVRSWVNVYDAADVLSYLAVPIFGPDAVTDVPMRRGANLVNAHGAYFTESTFYQLIADELRALL